MLELLDLGDHVGVEGRLMKTRTGEITLRVAGFTLLSKALRPLPLGKEDASGVKHGELTDPELRSRQRYADLAVHPEVREVFRLRTRIVQGIRAFLEEFLRSDLDLDALEAFDRPVLFVLGGRSHPDYFARMAERLAGVFPDFTIERFPERHHFDPPHRIEPDRVADSLRRLWARAEAGA